MSHLVCHYLPQDMARSDIKALRAQLENKTKHVTQAQIELRALQKSATSKGFGLIARKGL